jgi:predicted alpha/beta hydrolase
MHGQLLFAVSCRYKHMDMADLEAQLQAADQAGARVKLIATGTAAGGGMLGLRPGLLSEALPCRLTYCALGAAGSRLVKVLACDNQ